MNTKIRAIVALLLCCSLLPLGGCSTLGDDSFVINAKRGNTSQALANIKPHSGELRVTGVNGKTYYPIEYSLINGDRRLTYALIENGSPTRLYGKSLAYSAAYSGKESLARDLSSNGYGSSADIASAKSRRAADMRRRNQRNQAAAAFGLGILMAVMSGGGGGGGSSYDADHTNAVIGAMQ